jgi:hypothetical protein
MVGEHGEEKIRWRKHDIDVLLHALVVQKQIYFHSANECALTYETKINIIKKSSTPLRL